MARHLKITVEGKIYDVVVEDVSEEVGGSTYYEAPTAGMPASRPAPAPASPAAPARAPAAGGPADKAAPLAGVVIEISVSVGQQVKVGDKVAVIEAMKMKTVVSAHKDGKITNVAVKVGDAVEAGQPIVTIS
jgi:glutaconyl-CoA/methylmalonyl-CoA decarboxylase subunit gamma